MTARAAGWPRHVLALAVAPALAAIGVVLCPWIAVGEPGGGIIAFGAAAGSALLALALAASSPVSGRVAIALAGAGVAAVVAVALRPMDPRVELVAVNGALVLVGHAVGGSIGRRVEHPGHLLPASIVGAAFDLASVVHPSGPSRAIASSQKAMSLLAVGFAVPGTHAVAPALGVGDLVFAALVLGVASAHGLSIVRVACSLGVGIGLAGLLSATLGVAVPAIPAMAVALLVGVPAARSLRPRDRRVARIAFAVSAGVVIASVASALIR